MLTYREYYETIRRPAHDVDTLYDFTYKTFLPEFFGPDYLSLINQAKCDLVEKVKNEENIFTPPSGFSQEVQPILRLKDPWNLSSIERIAQETVPYLEQHIYGCPAYIFGCYVYQTHTAIQSRQSIGSLMWHYDNHPKEVIKIMVYLNDVDEDTAPFEIIRNKETKQALKMETHRISHKSWKKTASRCSEPFIRDQVENGYEKYKILGSPGTVCIFDNNIVHRANPAKKRPRNVVVFMAKPIGVSRKPDNYISKEHTGTNWHEDTFPDPTFIGVREK